MFNGKRPIQVKTDALDRAIEACLTQEYDKRRYPIVYYLRKLILAEQNYDIYDKELLVVVVALTYWRVYCEGVLQITIYTNYKNLLYFTTTKSFNQRQT